MRLPESDGRGPRPRDQKCRLSGHRVAAAGEKGYRAWGSDIGPDHTPLKAGLAWAVKLGTDIAFKGRDAVESQKSVGTPMRLTGFTVDDPEITLLGRETTYRNSVRVGWLTSGGWGHTIGTNIGYGYARSEDIADAAYVMAGQLRARSGNSPRPLRCASQAPLRPRHVAHQIIRARCARLTRSPDSLRGAWRGRVGGVWRGPWSRSDGPAPGSR